MTSPSSVLSMVLTASKIRRMAIRPRSSPRYALAADEPSENDPIIHPLPPKHSNTKAAEHKLGYRSLIYEPSVTATRLPGRIDSSIQWSSPTSHRESHIHVLFHSRRALFSILTRRLYFGCAAIALARVHVLALQLFKKFNS